MPTIEVKISAGLEYSTPIMCDNEIKQAGDIYLLQSGSNIKTFALEGNKIVNSNIINIPKQAYSDKMSEIIFTNGFHFQCTPCTKVLIYNQGYKEINTINADTDKAAEIFIKDSNIDSKPLDIKSVETTTETISKAVYLFMTQHGNLLLPYYEEDKGSLPFICVQQ